MADDLNPSRRTGWERESLEVFEAYLAHKEEELFRQTQNHFEAGFLEKCRSAFRTGMRAVYDLPRTAPFWQDPWIQNSQTSVGKAGAYHEERYRRDGDEASFWFLIARCILRPYSSAGPLMIDLAHRDVRHVRWIVDSAVYWWGQTGQDTTKPLRSLLARIEEVVPSLLQDLERLRTDPDDFVRRGAEDALWVFNGGDIQTISHERRHPGGQE